MHNEKSSTVPVDFCPSFRYIASIAESHLQAFACSTPETRDAVTLQALDFARLITNSIEPLSRQYQPANFAREYHNLAQRLYDLGRPWVHHHPSDFPEPANQSGLILDRIEQLEMRINQLLEKRRGKASAERRAA